jgi:hypothetical protein
LPADRVRHDNCRFSARSHTDTSGSLQETDSLIEKSYRGNVLLDMEISRYFVNMQFTAARKCVTSVETAPVTKGKDIASKLMY